MVDRVLSPRIAIGNLTIALMATSFLAFGVSLLVCRRPIYGALAARFLAVQRGGG